MNFPILAFLFVMLGDRVRLRAKQSGLYTFMIGLLVLPPLITLVQVQWTPGTGTAERYRMDIYYLLTLLCFLVIGFYHECLSVQQKRRFGCGVCYLCLYSVFLCLLLSLAPNDYNYTEWFPESLEHWRQILLLH